MSALNGRNHSSCKIKVPAMIFHFILIFIPGMKCGLNGMAKHKFNGENDNKVSGVCVWKWLRLAPNHAVTYGKMERQD